MKTTPLRLTREKITLINCLVKDDSSGGWPFHECCSGPTLTDAVACARRNMHHNYVDVYLEIRVHEVDEQDLTRSMTHRFVHPLTLDRALSSLPRAEQLVLLNEYPLYYECVASGASHATTRLDEWSEVEDWLRHHTVLYVRAAVNSRRDYYNADGVIERSDNKARLVTIIERDLCAGATHQ